MNTIERRIIYLIMVLAVGIPIAFKVLLKPARMVSAERMYDVVEGVNFSAGDVALLWMDFGPSSKAENEAQTEVILEHLMRRRMPIIIASQYQLSEGFLNSLPQRVADRLTREMPGEKWSYGTDWINIGYQVGGSLFVQALAKADNISSFIGKDFRAMPLSQYPRFAKIAGVEHVKLLAQVTSLVGTFDTFIQYFQKAGYKPTFVHGCTSITIPEAYIFLDSGQLNGLLEGIAGAAWYSEVLKEKFPKREPDRALVTNTALGVSQLVLLALIIAGNVMYYRRRYVRG